ncbi:MAG: lytic murein transglycosylase, partial [Chromatiaceae bacterium]
MYPFPTRMPTRRATAFLIRAGILTGLLLLAGVAAGEDAADRFLAAENALRSGDRATFDSLLAGLGDYPLYPYLRYAVLGSDLDSVADEAIESFLAEFPDTPLADRLRPVYLARLAAQGRWPDYARIYRPDDSAERRCLYLRALVETGQGAQALAPAEIERLWLVPRSQPAACDPLFAWWDDSGLLTTDLVWRRLRLAMESGEQGLARYLGRRLPESERPWVERWLAVYSSPDLILEPGTLAGDHPMRPAILAQGIARLARSNPGKALDLLAAEEGTLAGDPAASDSAHVAV